MMFISKWTPEMDEAVRPYLYDKTLVDLGAGDCELSIHMLHLGASQVLAVDKDFYGAFDHPKLTKIHKYFGQVAEELPARIDVAMISWPWTHGSETTHLIRLLDRARIVFYLGRNDGITACGCPRLFQWTIRRRLLHEIPHQRNTLLILGEPLECPRDPTAEEQQGLSHYR